MSIPDAGTPDCQPSLGVAVLRVRPEIALREDFAIPGSTIVLSVASA